MNYIVLDVETKKLFDEVPRGANDQLGVSYVGIYNSEDDSFKGFFEEEIASLWPLLEHTDMVIGYNIKGFDWPVLSPYYGSDLGKLPTLDLLQIIYDHAGFRLKLDDVARATLGMGKTGSGLDAYRYFKEGKLKELADYCLNDVKVTRDVYRYLVERGHVKYPDLGGVVKELPIKLELYLERLGKPEHQMTLI